MSNYLYLDKAPQLKSGTRLFGWEGKFPNQTTALSETYTYNASGVTYTPEEIIVYAGSSNYYGINKKTFKVSNGDTLVIETIGFRSNKKYLIGCASVTDESKFKWVKNLSPIVTINKPDNNHYYKFQIDIDFDAEDMCIVIHCPDGDLVYTGQLPNRSRFIYKKFMVTKKGARGDYLFEFPLSSSSSIDSEPLWTTRECGARVDNYLNSIVRYRKTIHFVSSPMTFDEAKEMEDFIYKNVTNMISFKDLEGTKDNHVYIIKSETIKSSYPQPNLQTIEFSAIQVGL